MYKKAFFFIFILLCHLSTVAQIATVSPTEIIDSPTSSIIISNGPPKEISSTGARAGNFGMLSSYEFYLSIFILVFGLVMIILEVILISRNRMSSDALIKFIVITLIITATLFLITAGYSNDQIAPAVGLFGTVAGYLLGKSNSRNSNENS